MPISFSCQACGKRLKAPESAAGKTSKCPGCGKPVTCPEPVYDAEPLEQTADVPEILDDIDPYSDLDDGTPYRVPGDDAGDSGEKRRPCPMCGEMIVVGAVKCRFCGEVFDQGLKQAQAKKKKKKRRASSSYDRDEADMSGSDIFFALLPLNCGCILSIIYMIQGKPKGLKMFGLSFAMQFLWGIAFAVFKGIGGNEPEPQPNVRIQPPPQIQVQPPNMPQPNFQPPGFPPPNMPQPNFQPPRIPRRRNF